ncbi:hypothetical protein [Blastococcus saxobsidens]|uniref:hypothetical protein n=1 Tax=Blastococcus saxobsidens TaxID=138336 RepID=UPI000CEC6747|nr:hypothetical protein [Blastococcus saxobsidens]
MSSPLWRQAYDAVEKAVTPKAEELVRTDNFALGVALARRVTTLARSSARDLTARAWHLVNLPAGSDIHRLRTQIGALDREVRRLTVALENERRRALPPRTSQSRPTEDSDADRAQPADDPRPRPARRRAQRPAGT